ncbi:MAG: ABC transporter permease [Spirochaetota bacterium]
MKWLLHNRTIRGLTMVLLSVILAMTVGSVVMALSGHHPVKVFIALFKGAFLGKRNIFTSLQRATPLMFTSLAAVFAFRTGLFNLGIEGQFTLGAIMGTYIGFAVPGLPPLFHVFLALGAAVLAGGLWAAIPGALKVWLGANEVIITIMFNYLARFGVSYLVNYPWRESAVAPMTPLVRPSAELTRLAERTQFNTGFFIAVAVVILAAFLLARTTLGYELRNVGSAPRFALFGGLPVKRIALTGMVLSGAFAGLGGGIEILGVHRRFIEEFSVGLGFDGILVALLGKRNPIGALFASVFYGGLKSGALAMEWTSEVPRELIGTIVSIIIFFLAAEGIFSFLWSLNRPESREIIKDA